MARTHSAQKTIQIRLNRELDFARCIFAEAATLFLEGEPDTAKVILRDLVNATIGFERLAQTLSLPSKSVHRMLSPSGNPTMANLSGIFGALGKGLKVRMIVEVKPRQAARLAAAAG